MRYVRAGHNPPLLWRAATGQVEKLEPEGIVLGVVPQIELEEAATDVAPGDILLFYTDGVTEAMNSDYEEFSDERLVELLKTHQHQPAADIVAAVTDAVNNYTKSHELYDDLTMVVLKRLVE